MKTPLRHKIDEVCDLCSTTPDTIIHYVEEQWITPIDRENRFFDDEDIARIDLIGELISSFGVNEEAIPVILHLIDQINYLHIRLKTN